MAKTQTGVKTNAIRRGVGYLNHNRTVKSMPHSKGTGDSAIFEGLNFVLFEK